MNIQSATTNDVEEIRALIIRSVEPENNPDFDGEGVQNFLKPNRLEAIRERISDKNYLTLCSTNENDIVGLITIYANSKIDQMFVDPGFRKQSVSKQLWLEAKRICSMNGNDGSYWVKSSSMAVMVYESFGFRKSGTSEKKNGITYYPMTLEI